MGTILERHYANPLDWAFRSRATGRITLFQVPNLPLWLALAALAVRLVAHPSGLAGSVLAVASSVLLLVWGVLEVVTGVNPFRRLLGAGVGLVQLVSLFALR